MTAPVLHPTTAKTEKGPYRVTHWPDYDRALVRRGRLTRWVDDGFLNARGRPAPTGRRGAPLRYAATAIQALVRLKAVFDLPYRRVEGLAGSIVRLLGVTRSIPDQTLLSRRAKTRRVESPRRARTGLIHLVVDSTGLTVSGEGDWTVRQHGAGQRRPWRQVQVAVDAQVKDVLAVEVTTAQGPDGDVFAGLLEPIEDPLAQVDADGAYDTGAGSAAAAAHGADLVLPPREQAVPWAAEHPRTQALADMATHGLSAWQRARGYPHRSLAEKARYRFNNWSVIAWRRGGLKLRSRRCLSGWPPGMSCPTSAGPFPFR